jgi:2-amino-4-hydroxy-6-hydroxymethyldihydropteridine diphosphokinase
MIFIAIGSNDLSEIYGTPLENCEAAITLLERRKVAMIRKSGWYETVPIPASAQPNFINGVICVETHLTNIDLLTVLLEIEAQMGRVRSVKNAARIVDLDLITYHDEIFNSDRLVLPHPRLSERAFVAQPIADLAPDWRHPISGLLITEILAPLYKQEIRRVSD